MEVILAVVRPKQNPTRLDYRSKLYDILLLDHKNVDKHGKPTKFFPTVSLTAEEDPRDEILSYLYKLTGGEHGGVKGERTLLIPWMKKDDRRESLSRFSLFCVPVNMRDKLNSAFVDKSPNSPGFYSLDSLIDSLNAATMNFPPPTKTFVLNLEEWLKEKHTKPGALELAFRTRADFRVKLSVNSPVFLPLSIGLSDSQGSLRNGVPEEIIMAANESLARMVSIEKCTNVVINPLFGSGLIAKDRVRPTWEWPDWFTNTPSRKSSLNSSVDPEVYFVAHNERCPLHIYACKGDIVKVEEYVALSESSILSRDSYGWMPIHCAAWYGHADIVKLFLNMRCSPNVVNPDDRTPLHLAAMRGNVEVANVLVNNPEVDMNLLDKDNRTALEICEQKLDWGQIKVAEVLEKATRQPKQIQVLTMDGQSKHLNLVDGGNTTVQQLNQQMLQEFSMPETPYADIFTIWICSPSLELQLKPEHKPLEHIFTWKTNIVLKLTDGDPIEEEPQLKWRRNAKISLIVEREVVNLNAINLLFHEARQNYINALYPCKEQDVFLFASILLYMNQNLTDPHAAKVFLSNNKNLQQLVPAPMLKHRSNWAHRIQNHYKEFCRQLERTDARLRTQQALQSHFLNSCRNLTVYGSAFFTGNLQTAGHGRMVKCSIGVNDVGLHIINFQSRVMLHSYKYSEISWWLPSDAYGVMEIKVVRNDARPNDRHARGSPLKLHTKQAGMINSLMKKLSHITYGIMTSRSLNVS